MARKTVDIKSVRDYANKCLRVSDDDMVGFRRGIIAMVEQLLMDTGNYKGFRYLDSQYAKGDDECDELAPVLRKGYDETRRKYYATLIS